MSAHTYHSVTALSVEKHRNALFHINLARARLDRAEMKTSIAEIIDLLSDAIRDLKDGAPRT